MYYLTVKSYQIKINSIFISCWYYDYNQYNCYCSLKINNNCIDYSHNINIKMVKQFQCYQFSIIFFMDIKICFDVLKYVLILGFHKFSKQTLES